MKFGTLVQHALGYKALPQIFLIFALGLSYGLSKSKKGVKSSKYLRQRFVDQPFFFHSAKTVSVYRNY